MGNTPNSPRVGTPSRSSSGTMLVEPAENPAITKQIYPVLVIPISPAEPGYFKFAKSVADGRLSDEAPNFWEGVEPDQPDGTSISWTKFVPVHGQSVELNVTFARQPDYSIANAPGDVKGKPEQLAIIRHRTKNYQMAWAYLLIVHPNEAENPQFKKSLQETLTAILHLGEIRDKKRPVFVAFLGEYSAFAKSVFDIAILCLRSFHVLPNLCCLFCCNPSNYGDIYRSLYACSYTVITKRKLSTSVFHEGIPLLTKLTSFGSMKVTVRSGSFPDVPKKASPYINFGIANENSEWIYGLTWKTKPGRGLPAATFTEDNTAIFEEIFEDQNPTFLRLEVWLPGKLVGSTIVPLANCVDETKIHFDKSKSSVVIYTEFTKPVI